MREVFAGVGCANASCRQNSNGATRLGVPGAETLHRSPSATSPQAAQRAGKDPTDRVPCPAGHHK